jgi:hypothetical protein
MDSFGDISVLTDQHEKIFWQFPEQCSLVGTARIEITNKVKLQRRSRHNFQEDNKTSQVILNL